MIRANVKNRVRAENRESRAVVGCCDRKQVVLEVLASNLDLSQMRCHMLRRALQEEETPGPELSWQVQVRAKRPK